MLILNLRSLTLNLHTDVYILYLFQTDYCSDMSPDFCKDHPYNDCRGPGFFHKCQKHCRGCIGKPLDDSLQAVKGFAKPKHNKNINLNLKIQLILINFCSQKNYALQKTSLPVNFHSHTMRRPIGPALVMVVMTPHGVRRWKVLGITALRNTYLLIQAVRISISQ